MSIFSKYLIMMKRFSRETYPDASKQLSRSAKFRSYAKQLANIIRVYEKREGLGDPYDHPTDQPEHKLAATIYELGSAQSNESKHWAGVAAWPNWKKDILQGAIQEFGIEDKSQFRRIMMYFGNLAATNDPATIQRLVHAALQRNL